MTKAGNRQSAVFLRPYIKCLWSGLGGGALALAGFLCHRYANLALCPATPIGVGASGHQPDKGGRNMRPVFSHAKQAQSPTPNLDADVQRERGALEHQRADLVRALAAAERSVKTFLPGSLEQCKARTRVTRLQNELRVIRGRLGAAKKHQNLGDLLVEVCRERVLPSEWRCILAEARRRHDAPGGLAAIGGIPVVTDSTETTPSPLVTNCGNQGGQ
jgi:hypothetical protein